MRVSKEVSTTYVSYNNITIKLLNILNIIDVSDIKTKIALDPNGVKLCMDNKCYL